jgi:hypothetical protein
MREKDQSSSSKSFSRSMHSSKLSYFRSPSSFTMDGAPTAIRGESITLGSGAKRLRSQSRRADGMPSAAARHRVGRFTEPLRT